MPAVGVTVIGLSACASLLTVTAETAKSFTLAASTATFTPAAVADVLTRLPSPVTAKDTSPSFKDLAVVDVPLSSAKAIV